LEASLVAKTIKQYAREGEKRKVLASEGRDFGAEFRALDRLLDLHGAIDGVTDKVSSVTLRQLQDAYAAARHDMSTERRS
jgi:hypothetical protein